jgi:hypothetical protein
MPPHRPRRWPAGQIYNGDIIAVRGVGGNPQGRRPRSYPQKLRGKSEHMFRSAAYSMLHCRHEHPAPITLRKSPLPAAQHHLALGNMLCAAESERGFRGEASGIAPTPAQTHLCEGAMGCTSAKVAYSRHVIGAHGGRRHPHVFSPASSPFGACVPCSRREACRPCRQLARLSRLPASHLGGNSAIVDKALCASVLKDF